ncbi:MAG: hypothetical protein U0234_17045 [Sandaracinus sp.]
MSTTQPEILMENAKVLLPRARPPIHPLDPPNMDTFRPPAPGAVDVVRLGKRRRG